MIDENRGKYQHGMIHGPKDSISKKYLYNQRININD